VQGSVEVATTATVPRGRAESRFVEGWHRYAGDRLAVVGLVIVAVVVFAAVFAPWVAPFDPNFQFEGLRRAGPGVEGHLLGTDEVGRDILSRLIYGGRLSLFVSVTPTVIAALIALGLGLIAGYVGGRIDQITMRVLDVFFAFPVVLLAILIAGVLGPGPRNQIIAIVFILVPYMARVVRTQVVSLRNQDFVEAARRLRHGAGGLHDSGRRRAQLLRPRRQPADLRLGLHGQHRQGDDHHLAPRRPDAERPHRPGGARLQLRRRRAAQRPRSAGERGMSSQAASAERTDQGRLAGDVLLAVDGLTVELERRGQRPLRAVDDVSLRARRGTVVGIVGESGSGKTMTANAVMRLLPRGGRIVDGTVTFDGVSLLDLDPEAMRRVRGKRIAMIFQNPMTSLNPAFPIGRQMTDMLVHHERIDRSDAMAQALALLRQVGIPEAERQVNAYPHQLSGGMRQRVVIAMALSCRPDLLIADEPTTALDVTIQAQILDLLDAIAADRQRAILFISHDFGVIARMCDDVVVMYQGKVVEAGPVARILSAPEHPYTRALLGTIPRADQRGQRLTTVEDQMGARL
jgi:peptide/nickel transport system permease protein